MQKVVIVGQGYVGLPLAQSAAQSGYEVVGYDLNENVVSGLNDGRSHVDDLSSAHIQEMLDSGYSATSDPAVFEEADVIVICVPTPLSDDMSPNLSAVVEATKTIAARFKTGTLVVLESTTYPGTTEQLLIPLLSKGGMQLDKDFYLAFSPERIDPGNEKYGLKNTPKVVGGVSVQSSNRAAEFYGRIVDQVVLTRGAKEAETAKLLENTYRHINIALVNEMARFCHELNIDLWDVIDAAKTKPFGFQAFYPGPGVGGHCIPIDPNYLSYEVQKTLGRPFRFVELAEEINRSMPHYVVDRAQDMLNAESKSLKGSRILLLGVAYKPNIADSRETPALPIAKILLEKGVELSYHDPRVPAWRVDETELISVDDFEVATKKADLVILLQNHREYEANDLASSANLFFDTRGASSSPNAIKI